MITRNREAHASAKSKPCQVPAPCQNISGSPWPAVSMATLTPFTVIDSGLKCMATFLVMSRGADHGAVRRGVMPGLARHDDFRKSRPALGLLPGAFLVAILELRQNFLRE